METLTFDKLTYKRSSIDRIDEILTEEALSFIQDLESLLEVKEKHFLNKE